MQCGDIASAVPQQQFTISSGDISDAGSPSNGCYHGLGNDGFGQTSGSSNCCFSNMHVAYCCLPDMMLDSAGTELQATAASWCHLSQHSLTGYQQSTGFVVQLCEAHSAVQL